MNIGTLIRQRREALNLSQEELGYKIGVGAQYISNIERGECGPPKSRLSYIAKVLRVPTKSIVRSARKYYLEKFLEKVS